MVGVGGSSPLGRTISCFISSSLNFYTHKTTASNSLTIVFSSPLFYVFILLSAINTVFIIKLTDDMPTQKADKRFFSYQSPRHQL